MPDNQFRRRVKVIVPILSLAVIAAFCLAGWSFYMTYQQACSSRNQTLNVLSDVVDIAVRPGPGERQTVAQERRAAAFRAAVRARIQQARC
jgi:hypothetical protein